MIVQHLSCYAHGHTESATTKSPGQFEFSFIMTAHPSSFGGSPILDMAAQHEAAPDSLGLYLKRQSRFMTIPRSTLRDVGLDTPGFLSFAVPIL